MSPGGNSERVRILRASIARLEAGSSPANARGGLCEVLPAAPGDAPAALAFALSLARCRTGAGPRAGALVWISDEMTLCQRGAPHAPGLAAHGLAAGQIILVRAVDACAALWAIEEALRSSAPAVVLGEVWDAARHCDLAVTRRLLLAARTGGALGLLLHPAPAPGILSTAARERFEVSALPGQFRPSAGGRRPIFGVPAWRVNRLKGQGQKLPEESPIEATMNSSRELSSAALSQPLHPRRAGA